MSSEGGRREVETRKYSGSEKRRHEGSGKGGERTGGKSGRGDKGRREERRRDLREPGEERGATPTEITVAAVH